jgi:hypothetical protein
MAANEYYNQSSHPDALPAHPQYQSYNPPDQPPFSSAPPYQSNPPSRVPSTRPHEASPVSPFETPFDDRVYPLGRPAAQPYESQSTLGQDSGYYGQGGGGRPQDSTGSFRDDIPLRDHPQVPPKDNYANDVDHVYDAPAHPSHLEAARPDRRSGKGFLKSGKGSKWKLAWVCYIFGTIQLVVFIVEIVKNGKHRL